MRLNRARRSGVELPMRLLSVLLAAPLCLAASPAPIPNGLYHCRTGGGQLVLAFGDVTITSDRYVLVDPDRRRTSGTYAVGPLGYRWSGDFGVVKHQELADSTADPGGFTVRYALGHTSPVSITCRR